MRKLEHFGYEKVAREMHVPEDILKRIEKEVEEDYSPDSDKILYELHVLRAVRSEYWKSWIRSQK